MSEKNIPIKIPKRILGTVLNSAAAGVVPRFGLEYMAIGRNDEVTALLGGLENVADGMGDCRFIIGKYGSGKSFLIGLIRCNALEKGFVTADTDLSPERRFIGTRGQGIATYRELMKNLACKTSPDGGALPVILTKWLSALQAETVTKDGISQDDPAFTLTMDKKIMEVAASLEGLVNGFDFASVLSIYYRAVKSGDDEKKSCALRWLRGEYSNKLEVRGTLGINSLIDDSNWYDYVKLFAVFFRKIGYKGFVVFFDECVNLYKIPHKMSRENNYEKILSMFNDTLQGKAEGLGLILGGTPQFLEDERRGLFSYDALKSRLSGSRVAKGNYKNFMGPVIYLDRLSDDELYALIMRMLILHKQYYAWEPEIADSEILEFLQLCFNKMGADTLLTPREIIRDFLGVLNIMYQNSGVTFSKVISDGNVTLKSDAESGDDDDIFDLGSIEI
ncbi:MAG: biotin carboxylase [Ruminococcaceae bacterium]|nr:biotin carboxylase [Oscillospiraceae bacterium]